MKYILILFIFIVLNIYFPVYTQSESFIYDQYRDLYTSLAMSLCQKGHKWYPSEDKSNTTFDLSA